jgi:hypothetical protein
MLRALERFEWGLVDKVNDCLKCCIIIERTRVYVLYAQV